MYLSILIFPLLGSISAGFLGRKIGFTGAHFITCSCLIISSILVTFAFYEVGICGSPVTINLFSWIDSEFMSISWEFMFDQLTVSLSLAVVYCSTLIHIYSVDYLSSDPHNQRFFSYLSLFTFFMLFLVSAGNYLVMFVGWEGIGVVSYLLINFYFTRVQSNKAAILALTMNRVGDFGLSVAFFAIFGVFGSLNYATVFSLAPFINETAITIIALLLLSGAMAKSAQLPLHSWLPGSMEAPTPVSALLHAATLVTAGIYLLLRSSPILEYSPTALLIITFIGASTAFFGATCGLVANDLKRIIAMSTISQLGYCYIFFILLAPLTILFCVANFDFNQFNIYMSHASLLPVSSLSKALNKTVLEKDKFKSIQPAVNYIDKFTDYTYNGKTIIKQKYLKVKGIYLWVNEITGKSYVGKSINLYQRFNQYFSTYYINNTKSKMAICGAIFKYNIGNFTLYVLEVVDSDKSKEWLSERENYWCELINPSYNIQSIIQPFTGANHYRFGSKLSEALKSKISNTLP